MPDDKKPATPPAAAAQKPAPAPVPEKKSPYKKYEDVITKEAVTQMGLFKVHRIEDRIFYEIPDALIGREFLWQTEVSELAADRGGFPGMPAGTRVIRFGRRNTKLFMRGVDHSVRTRDVGAIREGVQATTVEPILLSMDVQTEGEWDGKKTAVVDVTSLFTSDPQDFSVRGMLGGAGVDNSRSYIDRVKAFPTNIETRSVLTFASGQRQGNPFFGMGGGRNSSATTATVHYSLLLLPEKPMIGRLKDSRIGYFTNGYVEYGRPENRSVNREYINRYRLEKKDPNAALSEPTQPIVFYLAREVPEKWRSYIKKGIEDWQPAFEKAGFKNAILAKDAPTAKEDPTWDAEDARYSVIRWAPSPIANAMGPSIQDPRSGETISAHIIFWNDIVTICEQWYFAQCAAVDPRARKLPMADDLMGELIRYVAAHEVGHTLGLEHNFKSNAYYPVEWYRNPAKSQEMGLAASIMDYARFNYIAQPGDGPVRTIGKLGPYDFFAVEYGYRPVPGARTADDEKPWLDRFLAQQVNEPTLRFGNYKFPDPTTQTEDIGDDAVAASRLGFKNLDLIADQYLLSSTSKFGEDYSRLQEFLDALFMQRVLLTMHVSNNVGGIIETDYHAGRGSEVFAPVPLARQRAAMGFLVNEGLAEPVGLYRPEIVNRLRPGGIVALTTRLQSFVLSDLMDPSRYAALVDQQVSHPGRSYPASKYLDEVVDGVIGRDFNGRPVSVYRRALHRNFLRQADQRVNTSGRNEFRTALVARLTALQPRAAQAARVMGDPVSRTHWQEVATDIQLILEDKYSRPSSPAFPNILSMLFGNQAEAACEHHQGHTGEAGQVRRSCFSNLARTPLRLQRLWNEYKVSEGSER
jgi:hypothetical protein